MACFGPIANGCSFTITIAFLLLLLLYFVLVCLNGYQFALVRERVLCTTDYWMSFCLAARISELCVFGNIAQRIK